MEAHQTSMFSSFSGSSTGTTPQSQTHSFFVSLSAVYGFIFTLLVSLIEIKYQGLSTNPFQEPSIIMLLFLVAIFTHATARVAKIILQADDNTWSANIIFHFSGVLAIETLLWTLVGLFWWWIIVNVILLLVVALCFYKYIFMFLNNHLGTCFQWILKNCKKVVQRDIRAQTADLETEVA